MRKVSSLTRMASSPRHQGHRRAEAYQGPRSRESGSCDESHDAVDRARALKRFWAVVPEGEQCRRVVMDTRKTASTAPRRRQAELPNLNDGGERHAGETGHGGEGGETAGEGHGRQRSSTARVSAFSPPRSEIFAIPKEDMDPGRHTHHHDQGGNHRAQHGEGKIGQGHAPHQPNRGQAHPRLKDRPRHGGSRGKSHDKTTSAPATRGKEQGEVGARWPGYNPLGKRNCPVIRTSDRSGLRTRYTRSMRSRRSRPRSSLGSR